MNHRAPSSGQPHALLDDRLRAFEVDSLPESRVHNSQPHGIGRVVALNTLGAWSNLGRNVVFIGQDLRPRAVFDESAYSADEPSQYDLDVHAILELPEAGIVLTLNHLGTVRAFRTGDILRPGSLRRVAAVWTGTFAADVERAVVVEGRLVGSRPRSNRAGGLLISESLGMKATHVELHTNVALEPWGRITALAAMPDSAPGKFAFGGDGRISIAMMNGDRVDGPFWCTTVDFEPAVLLWDGRLLWAAGSRRDPTVDDYDWNALRGGGFVALDAADGHAVVRGRFDDGLAWGNGGVPLAMASSALFGFGRTGQLYVYDTRDGALVATSAPTAEASLGIAHGAVIGNHVVYGFNRGGYRLHRVPFASVRNVLSSRRRRLA